jgi:hypothetical protein
MQQGAGRMAFAADARAFEAEHIQQRHSSQAQQHQQHQQQQQQQQQPGANAGRGGGSMASKWFPAPGNR